jgi:hypothetical protein
MSSELRIELGAIFLKTSGEKDQTARVRVCPAVTRFRLSMDHG